ncbi:hypothetical protein FB451DRAFT_1298670 [Mycena latifolia]|nr:hypothetical protein FB451DRAFT_1298670 [Mycena latifolia]
MPAAPLSCALSLASRVLAAGASFLASQPFAILPIFTFTRRISTTFFHLSRCSSAAFSSPLFFSPPSRSDIRMLTTPPQKILWVRVPRSPPSQATCLPSPPSCACIRSRASVRVQRGPRHGRSAQPRVFCDACDGARVEKPRAAGMRVSIRLREAFQLAEWFLRGLYLESFNRHGVCTFA